MREAIELLVNAANAGRPFDQAHYPQLDMSDPGALHLFCLEHMLTHAQRDAGVLAGIAERFPHKKEPAKLTADQQATAMRIGMKFVVIGLRLFSTMGGTAEQLQRYINDDE